MITDPTLVRIGEAVQLAHRGEREAARLRFAELWEEISEGLEQVAGRLRGSPPVAREAD